MNMPSWQKQYALLAKDMMGYLGSIGHPIEEEYVTQSSLPVELIVFSQHGMADNNRAMGLLARKVSLLPTCIIAPDLGLIHTLFEIEPLIRKVEEMAGQTFNRYAGLPARLMATSLGGVIWVEVLSRHPEWWSHFESLVLLGSPIGGADLARIVDPFSWGIGIAKHLGKNRRALAEQITVEIPTLVVTGNITGGGDGTVSIESTKLNHAHYACLDNVTHSGLRTHPSVVKVIRDFWAQPRQILSEPNRNLVSELIEHFRAVPGITDASARDFSSAKTIFSFDDGTSISTWKNLVGVDHVFIANKHGECKYSAFVGWAHSKGLRTAIDIAIRSFS